MWTSWINPEEKEKKQKQLRQLQAQYDALSPSVAALIYFSLGSVTAISAALVYRRYGRRVRNSDWVTPRLLTRKRWLKGVVTRYAPRNILSLLLIYYMTIALEMQIIFGSFIHLHWEGIHGLLNSELYPR